MRASKLCIGGEGAPSEIIDNGVTGFVVAPYAPDAPERLGDLVVETIAISPVIFEKARSSGAGKLPSRCSRQRRQEPLAKTVRRKLRFESPSARRTHGAPFFGLRKELGLKDV